MLVVQGACADVFSIDTVAKPGVPHVPASAAVPGDATVVLADVVIDTSALAITPGGTVSLEVHAQTLAIADATAPELAVLRAREVRIDGVVRVSVRAHS